MKHLYLIAALLISTISKAQIVDIPDPEFKNILVTGSVTDTDGDGVYDDDVDTNNDGEIQITEAEAINYLNVNSSGYDITSLVGIEYFVNIEYLNFGGQDVTEIDLSQNVNLIELEGFLNQLTSLDISSNILLERVSAGYNPIIEFDISNNPNLKDLRMASCEIEGYFDTTQNPNLESLYIGQNYISSFDLSQNPLLESFSIFWNDGEITALDLSQNTNLVYVNLQNNDFLEELNIKNGYNELINTFIANSNSALYCIQVDNVEYSENNNSWDKDAWAEYNENCILGLNDHSSFEINLYPNPSQDFLYINTEMNIDTVTLYSLTGQLIKQTSNMKIDVSGLTAGIYFATIALDERTTTKKFIKS